MSISLSNHEDRIKTLENSKGVGSITSVWTSSTVNDLSTRTVTVDTNATHYICIVYVNQDLLKAMQPVLVGKFNSNKEIELFHNAYGNGSDGKCYISYDGVKTITARVSSGNCGINAVIGLKIYYIFRYNIYKILKLISPILKF